MAADHYATLGIPRLATPEQIKRAYREQAKRLHPDRDPSPLAASRFIAAQHAYETLRDPFLRLAYDARFNAAHHRDQRYRPPYATARASSRPMDPPDLRVRSWPFIGLHVAGLGFGVILILGIVTGILFRDWPWLSFIFSVPGFIVIPDAWSGILLLKRGRPRGREAF
jgi:curved DNA-binding protein CbpA